MPEQNEVQFKERRRFVRLKAEVDVEYEIIVQTPSGSKETISKDISAGGICIILDEKLEADTNLNLVILLPDGSSPIKAEGRVVWSKAFKIGPEHERYDTGVEFIEIVDSDQKRINDYIFKYK